MMKKRPLCILLAMCMTFGIFISSSCCANSENTFSDVSSSDWYYDAVQYVYKNELMSGTGNSRFSPNGTTTRGMIVTILWRLEGRPTAPDCTFSDISAGQYYTAAVAWAAANNIVSGYGNGMFGPNDNITREQMAAILYRYASYKSYKNTAETDLSNYSDLYEVSSYAVKAMGWANGAGIISGSTNTTLNPKGYALRSQVAAILQRFCENIVPAAPESSESPIVTPIPSDTGSIPGKGESGNKDDGTPKIIVSSVTAAPGDKAVLVSIDIKNNPGIVGMALCITYDGNVMSMESAENGDAFNNVLTLTKGKNLHSGCKFVWDGLSVSKDNIKDGSVLLMKFNISDSAAAGSYPINVTYANGDIVDNDLTAVSPTVQNSTVTVKK